MKTISIISFALIVLFSACMVSANTLFTKAEWTMLENWNNNGTKNSIEKPEGYSEIEGVKQTECDMFNTCFSKEEWEVLKNWNYSNP